MTTPVALPPHDVTDLGLADEGVRRIEWAEREMPVLRLIRERFARELPLRGLRIARRPFGTGTRVLLDRLLAEPQDWRIAYGERRSIAGYVLPQARLFLPRPALPAPPSPAAPRK